MGTAFLDVFYPTFSYSDSTVTLGKKYNVDSSAAGLHIGDEYRLPVVIVGALVSLLSVFLLFTILKKVKLDNVVNVDIPMY